MQRDVAAENALARNPWSVIPQPPASPRGEIRNLPPRPHDPFMQPLAEALSPTMGAYDTANMLSGLAADAFQGNWSDAADKLPMALGMAAGVRAKTASPFMDRMRQRVKEMQDQGVGKGEINRAIVDMRRDEFARLYSQDVTVQEINNQLGLGSYSSSHYLNAIQGERRGRGSHQAKQSEAFWEQNRAEMQRLYDDGASIAAIADAVGRDRNTVARGMDKLGLPARNPPPREESTLSSVEAMRRQGHSYGDIAGELGLTRSQVAGVVRDLRAKGIALPAAAIAPLAGTLLDYQNGLAGDDER